MKNHLFSVEIEHDTGFISSIQNVNDTFHMNWCSDSGHWGRMKTPCDVKLPFYYPDYYEAGRKDVPFVLKEFNENENVVSCLYENSKLSVTVNRFFTEAGNLKEQMIIKNISPSVYCLCRDNFAIELPFNEQYPGADKCMTQHCNTHIWCGKNSSWVNALKMGISDINLGLVLTKGSFISYSQDLCFGSARGNFLFEPETRLLKQGEEYTIEWELFWHTGKEDFFHKLSSYDTYIGINAKHFTVFEGENIEFTITTPDHTCPVVLSDDSSIDVIQKDDCFAVSYTPSRTGPHRFLIQCGNLSTYTEFMVKIPFAKLVEKRVNFIVDHQQCLDQDSPLYGAYLIYDNTLSSQYFDFFIGDHNACRERMNMPLTLIRYLQLHDDEKIRKSVDLYMDFLFREFYEEKTGEVYNNIGKTKDALRLYNAPGVMLIFAEMYYLTKEDRYLDNIVMLADNYYHIGGEKCYSNAVAIRKVIGAFELAKRYDHKKKMLDFFRFHVNTILNNGLSYPKHETNYEQTIVTPAVTCISEMGLFCEEKDTYLSNVLQHITCLDHFMGNQPSFHLNEIAIRFWDDFWFGKAHKCGDTLPHHLSCLTARAFIAYARLSDDKRYIERAEECLRNCLCLIHDNGQGSAAYVYPHMVNNENGEFYDGWANDQDLSLYDAMNCSDLIEAFRI